MYDDKDLDFKANDPGAVRHGNFINYYQFHPPGDRMKFFPTDLWHINSGEKFVCLDIGCNAGDLTLSLYDFLSKNLFLECSANNAEDVGLDGDLPISNCFVLGVDIDSSLILRANESNIHPQNVTYECLDFMTDNREEVLSTFLLQNNKHLRFDAIFCFSVTMWIHLNHGDEGLKNFLTEVANRTNMLVVEPQPWKCYRNAVRRLKRSSGDTFPRFHSLKWRESVEVDIEKVLQNECDFQKVLETPQTDWGRKLLFYKRKTVLS